MFIQVSNNKKHVWCHWLFVCLFPLKYSSFLFLSRFPEFLLRHNYCFVRIIDIKSECIKLLIRKMKKLLSFVDFSSLFVWIFLFQINIFIQINLNYYYCSLDNTKGSKAQDSRNKGSPGKGRLMLSSISTFPASSSGSTPVDCQWTSSMLAGNKKHQWPTFDCEFPPWILNKIMIKEKTK